jgi:hypothetical protein
MGKNIIVSEAVTTDNCGDSMARKSVEDIPNCWEFLGCDMDVCGDCTAYPDHGRECWKLTGTKCKGGKFMKTTIEDKLLHCRNECDFYKTHLKELYP